MNTDFASSASESSPLIKYLLINNTHIFPYDQAKPPIAALSEAAQRITSWNLMGNKWITELNIFVVKNFQHTLKEPLYEFQVSNVSADGVAYIDYTSISNNEPVSVSTVLGQSFNDTLQSSTDTINYIYNDVLPHIVQLLHDASDLLVGDPTIISTLVVVTPLLLYIYYTYYRPYYLLWLYQTVETRVDLPLYLRHWNANNRIRHIWRGERLNITDPLVLDILDTKAYSIATTLYGRPYLRSKQSALIKTIKQLFYYSGGSTGPPDIYNVLHMLDYFRFRNNVKQPTFISSNYPSVLRMYKADDQHTKTVRNKLNLPSSRTELPKLNSFAGRTIDPNNTTAWSLMVVNKHITRRIERSPINWYSFTQHSGIVPYIDNLFPFPFAGGMAYIKHATESAIVTELLCPTYPAIFNKRVPSERLLFQISIMGKIVSDNHPGTLALYNYHQPTTCGYYGLLEKPVYPTLDVYTPLIEPIPRFTPVSIQQYINTLHAAHVDAGVSFCPALVFPVHIQLGSNKLMKYLLHGIPNWIIERDNNIVLRFVTPVMFWLAQYLNQHRASVSYCIRDGRVSRFDVVDTVPRNKTVHSKLMWTEYCNEIPVPSKVYCSEQQYQIYQKRVEYISSRYLHSVPVQGTYTTPTAHTWVIACNAVLMPIVSDKGYITSSTKLSLVHFQLRTRNIYNPRSIARMYLPDNRRLFDATAIQLGQCPLIWLGTGVLPEQQFIWPIDRDYSTLQMRKNMSEDILTDVAYTDYSYFVPSVCTESVKLVHELVQYAATIKPQNAPLPMYVVPTVWMTPTATQHCVCLDLSFTYIAAEQQHPVVWVCYAIISLEHEAWYRTQYIPSQLVSTPIPSSYIDSNAVRGFARARITALAEAYVPPDSEQYRVDPITVRDWVRETLIDTTVENFEYEAFAVSVTLFAVDKVINNTLLK